ncbi:MAG TPA: GNAT family N-acetyltransferase [Planctomycetes bacterium]|nr:GNAT family N-acetyltransferase [Planctomycetota bacterium]
MTQIRILPKTEHDIPGLERLFKVSQQDPSNLQESLGFVAKSGERVLGFIGMELGGMGSVILKRLVLDPSIQGHGFTNDLSRKVEDWARELHQDRLVLFTDRREGFKWAREHGFKEVEPARIKTHIPSWSFFGEENLEKGKFFTRPVIKGLLILGCSNGGRTLMAEAVARTLAPGRMSIYSASLEGNRPMDPLADRVFKEMEISFEGLHPKPLDEIPLEEVNYIISFDKPLVSGLDPEFVGALKSPWQEWVWELPDPRLESGDEEAQLESHRKVYKEIQRRIECLFGHRMSLQKANLSPKTL